MKKFSKKNQDNSKSPRQDEHKMSDDIGNLLHGVALIVVPARMIVCGLLFLWSSSGLVRTKSHV